MRWKPQISGSRRVTSRTAARAAVRTTVETTTETVSASLQERGVDASAAELLAKRIASRLESGSAESYEAVLDGVALPAGTPFTDLAKRRIEALLQRRVRNDALKSLQETLTAQQLSFEAYNNASMRWRSLIARPEFPTLHEAWGKEVRVASSPVPLALEEPAADTTELERSLLKESEARLIKTLSADKLTVLVELIASTEEAPTE